MFTKVHLSLTSQLLYLKGEILVIFEILVDTGQNVEIVQLLSSLSYSVLKQVSLIGKA